MKSILKWAEEVHELAKRKGWHNKDEIEDHFIERSCNNLHDEVSELHEACRSNKLHIASDKSDKMIEEKISSLTYLEEELADIIIRTLDIVKKLCVNIEYAIERKHVFNETRSFRHGCKRS